MTPIQKNIDTDISQCYSVITAEKELIRQAEEEGVKVYGLSEYFVEEDRRKKEKGAVILLGYANMGEDKIREAVHRLEKAWGQNRKQKD